MRERKERTDLPLINERIRAPRVQLIAAQGENVGVVSRIDALRMASEAGLDLVLLSETGSEGVPVVKIMDFGKSAYEKKKKQVRAKKQQKIIQIKEIKLKPKISEHDLSIKIKQAIQFFAEGKRVKITLTFRGRENATRNELGPELFARVGRLFDEYGYADKYTYEQDSGQMWSRIYYTK